MALLCTVAVRFIRADPDQIEVIRSLAEALCGNAFFFFNALGPWPTVICVRVLVNHPISLVSNWSPDVNSVGYDTQTAQTHVLTADQPKLLPNMFISSPSTNPCLESVLHQAAWPCSQDVGLKMAVFTNSPRVCRAWRSCPWINIFWADEHFFKVFCPQVRDTRTIGFPCYWWNISRELWGSNTPNDLCTGKLGFTWLTEQPCSCVASGLQVGKLHEALLSFWEVRSEPYCLTNVHPRYALRCLEFLGLRKFFPDDHVFAVEVGLVRWSVLIFFFHVSEEDMGVFSMLILIKRIWSWRNLTCMGWSDPWVPESCKVDVFTLSRPSRLRRCQLVNYPILFLLWAGSSMPQGLAVRMCSQPASRNRRQLRSPYGWFQWGMWLWFDRSSTPMLHTDLTSPYFTILNSINSINSHTPTVPPEYHYHPQPFVVKHGETHDFPAIVPISSPTCRPSKRSWMPSARGRSERWCSRRCLVHLRDFRGKSWTQIGCLFIIVWVSPISPIWVCFIVFKQDEFLWELLKKTLNNLKQSSKARWCTSVISLYISTVTRTQWIQNPDLGVFGHIGSSITNNHGNHL